MFYIEKVTQNCSIAGSSFVDSMEFTPAGVPKQNNAEGDILVRFLYGVQLGSATIKGPRSAPETIHVISGLPLLMRRRIPAIP